MVRAYLLRPSSVGLMLAALVITGCGHSISPSETKTPQVTVAHPEVRSLVDEDVYNGWLVAYETQEVRARVRGHIKKVHFNGGEIVQVGDPLFDLDPEPFEADIKRVEAQALAFAAQKTAAEKDVVRYRALLQSGGATQQQFEKAQADAESYEAQIAATRAQVERLQLDLKYAKVVAEQAGKISKPALTKGNLANAGGSDPLLATIKAIEPIYVDFNVDERRLQEYLQLYPVSQEKDKPRSLEELKIPFRFALDTDKGFPREGVLRFTEPKLTENTGTILVHGLAHNLDRRLIPGSRVRVQVSVGDNYQAVVVPDTAVLADQDQRYLLVLDRDNKVSREEIKRGKLLEDGMRVIPPPAGQETAGKEKWLKDWEQKWVITAGLQQARVGQPAEAFNAEGQRIGNTGTAQ